MTDSDIAFGKNGCCDRQLCKCLRDRAPCCFAQSMAHLCITVALPAAHGRHSMKKTEVTRIHKKTGTGKVFSIAKIVEAHRTMGNITAGGKIVVTT